MHKHFDFLSLLPIAPSDERPQPQSWQESSTMLSTQPVCLPDSRVADRGWCDRVTEVVVLVPTVMPSGGEKDIEFLRRCSLEGHVFARGPAVLAC
jgi:hypothetical protein